MTESTDGVVWALKGVVTTHGVDRVTTDAAWVRNILADLSPETRAFNRVLMVAVQEGIPADLRRAATGGSVALAIARGVDRLVADYGTDRRIATDAVNVWARILGLAGTVAPAPVPPPKPTVTPPTVPVPLAPAPVPLAVRRATPPTVAVQAPTPSTGSRSPVVTSSNPTVTRQNAVSWQARARLALTLIGSVTLLLAGGDWARKTFFMETSVVARESVGS